MGFCNQLNRYVPGLGGEQAEFRKLLKKYLHFVVTERMEDKFGSAKRAMVDSILLNSFDVNRKSLVITDASGDGFGHILRQKKENDVLAVRVQTTRRTGEVGYRWELFKEQRLAQQINFWADQNSCWPRKMDADMEL